MKDMTVRPTQKHSLEALISYVYASNVVCQNRSMSNLNNRRFAMRAMLPVKNRYLS